MSDWKRNEKTTTVVQYIVPADDKWGACWNEVQQALSKAITDWRELNEAKDYPPDNAIRVFPRDDEIVIEFDKPVGPKFSTPEQQRITDAVIEDRTCAYAREVVEMSHADDPALLTKGGVAALVRDAYRTGAIRTASQLGSRGASRYDNSGTDRRTYEEPACKNNAPHEPHMHSPIGGLTLNCCGVS